MSDDDLPKAIWSGSFKLFGVEVKCHTLNDGQRIIEADNLAALFDAMAGSNATYTSDEMFEFSKWQSGK
jgi:hypothetical protein